MSPKELTTFRVAPDIMAGLRHVKDRDGVPLSVQLDRALRAWLRSKAVGKRAERKRVVARKRS